MRPRRAPRGADQPQSFAAPNFLTGLDFQLGEVAVARRQAVAVVDDDRLPVTVLPAGLDDRSGGGREDGRAVRGGDVLPGVELGASAAERVAPVAEAVRGLAFDGPDRGDARALLERRLVDLQVHFEPRGAQLQPLDRLGVERGAAGAVRARALLLLLLLLPLGGDAGHLGEAAGRVFDGVHAVFELPELSALALVLDAEAVVLLLDAQVQGLLRQAVDAVRRAAEEHGDDDGRGLDPALVDGDAADVGT